MATDHTYGAEEFGIDPSIHTVIVGVDGSDSSVEALRWAVGQAAHNNSHVIAVAAWTWPETWGTAVPFPSNWSPEEDTVAMLDDIVAPISANFPDVHITAKALEGHPKNVLVEASHHADLVVLGDRGHHHKVAEKVLGSVSHYVTTHAAAPVLVHRTHPTR